MSLITTLGAAETFRDVIEDRTFPTVRDWRARHGKPAAAYFPVYAPAELADAAGMLPVGVFGGGNRIEIANADSRFQSFICSIVKSTLELGFIGALDPFDAMLFSSICDPARNLASVMARNFPARKVVYVHLAQNMTSAGVVEYLAGEYRRAALELASVTGKVVNDDDIRASLAAYEAARARIRSLYELRTEAPQKLSTSELYILSRLTTLSDPREVLPVLDEALAGARARTERPKDRIKVVLVGSFCEQPPLELIESLEQAGCYIVDDDLLLGWRWFTRTLDVAGDPYVALARSYIDASAHASPKHDLRRPRAASLIETATRDKADAVIFLGAKFCEPGLFDYARYRKALEEKGIPHLFLEFEEKMWLYDRIRGEVETFVESMLFA